MYFNVEVKKSNQVKFFLYEIKISKRINNFNAISNWYLKYEHSNFDITQQ